MLVICRLIVPSPTDTAKSLVAVEPAPRATEPKPEEFALSPIATPWVFVATEFEPSAKEFSPEAKADPPIAVAPVLVAFAPAPTAVAPSARPFAKYPTAVDCVPDVAAPVPNCVVVCALTSKQASVNIINGIPEILFLNFISFLSLKKFITRFYTHLPYRRMQQNTVYRIHHIASNLG